MLLKKFHCINRNIAIYKLNKMKGKLLSEIEEIISNLDKTGITDERKGKLSPLIDFIQEKIDAKRSVRLNFICTHNSRRSHISQIWAQTLAKFYGVQNFTAYSGGTESTEINPQVVKTFAKQGFQFLHLSKGDNPCYAIKYAYNEHPIIAFSKTYESAFNPMNGFAAIMTCSEADGGCPFISGAEKRIPLTYLDPKEYDGTPLQQSKYMEKSLEIARELNYVFSQIKTK